MEAIIGVRWEEEDDKGQERDPFTLGGEKMTLPGSLAGGTYRTIPKNILIQLARSSCFDIDGKL